MNQKQTERLIAAIEKLAEHVGGIRAHLEKRPSHAAQALKLRGPLLTNSDFEPVSEATAMAEMGIIDRRTFLKHCDNLKFDPTSLLRSHMPQLKNAAEQSRSRKIANKS
jgi:hypothetical protein